MLAFPVSMIIGHQVVSAWQYARARGFPGGYEKFVCVTTLAIGLWWMVHPLL